MKLKQFLSNKFKEHELKREQNEAKKNAFWFMDEFLSDLFPTDDKGILRSLKDIEISRSKIMLNLAKKCNNPYAYFQELYREERAFKMADEASRARNYDSSRIIYHVRDNQWLVEYIRSYVEKVTYNTIVIPSSTINDYVENSPKFNQRRNQYEKALVKNYIEYYMKDGGYVDNEKRKSRKENLSVESLYTDVLNDMVFLGLDRHNVELGLELNADYWRERLKSESFFNLFKNDNLLALSEFDHDRAVNLHNQKYAIYDMLSIYYDRKYYQEHKAIIDEAGTAKPCMKFSQKKYEKICEKGRKALADYKTQLYIFKKEAGLLGTTM